MNCKHFLSYCLLLYCTGSFAQGVGIGTAAPHASAMLEISSNNKGFLPPRLSTAQRSAIASPAKGLLVFDDNISSLYFFNGSAWEPLSGGWQLAGNAGINPASQFLGTTDNQPLRLRLNNEWAGELSGNTHNYLIGRGAAQATTSADRTIAVGSGALRHNTIVPRLLAIGDSALYNNGIGNTSGLDSRTNLAIGSKALFSNTVGSQNLAIGTEALMANTTGGGNLAIGAFTLAANSASIGNTAIGFLGQNLSTGGQNTSVGFTALRSNTTGSQNTALGYQALFFNSTGGDNTAIGSNALFSNTVGNYNTAVGTKALTTNLSGGHNTAVGYLALSANIVDHNTAMGFESLRRNTSGAYNAAFGSMSMPFNISGNFNTALGVQALSANTNGSGNTSGGFQSLYNNTSGANNTALGYIALHNNVLGSWNVAIGREALRFNSGALAHYNVAIGGYALYNTTNSQFNTVVGTNSASQYNMGYNNAIFGANNEVNAHNLFNIVAVGQAVPISASNQARLGNAATNSIGGFANWSNVSDTRFKKNISSNVPGLDFIMLLRPVTYQLDVDAIHNTIYPNERPWMNEDMLQAVAEKSAFRYSGFLAQEVEMSARKIGYDFSGVDAPKNDKDFYGLRYAEFVVPLVKAVQEQQEYIRMLEQRIRLLERLLPER